MPIWYQQPQLGQLTRLHITVRETLYTIGSEMVRIMTCSQVDRYNVLQTLATRAYCLQQQHE